MDSDLIKVLVLHLLRDRALVTSSRVDTDSVLSVTALTNVRGSNRTPDGSVDRGLEHATAVTLEVRTLDPVSMSNDERSRLDLDLAVAFLLRVIGAGGERAEELRRMFRMQDGRRRLRSGKK